MPSVDVAMARSLRGGFLDLLAASMRPVVQSRDAITDVQDHITDVKTAFSSWDNCMHADFCKWPVIAIIVIGGLIIISIIWCIVRCACCGLSCCCECFHCLKCCGNCCGCCDPPRGRPHKYLDEPYIPPHHAAQNAYRSHEPMNAAPAFPRTAEPPQYAEFETSKKPGVHEDALPEMPSWENANSKKVLVEEEAVELESLKKPEASSAGAAHGQNLPLMTGATATPGPASPIHSPHATSPYGPAGGAAGDPYAQGGQNGQGYDYNGAYGRHSPGLGVDQGYGMAGGAMAAGRRSPRGYDNGGFGQAQNGYAGGYPVQREFDNRSPQQPYDDYGQHPNQGYGMGPGRRSPPRGNPNMRNGGYGAARQSPAPQGDYGYDMNAGNGAYSPPGQHQLPYPADGAARSSPAPQGDYGHDMNAGNGAYSPPGQHQLPYPGDGGRPYRGPPQRQYSHDVPPSPTTLQNNGGFDFNSGYSRRPTPGAAPQEQPQPQQAAYPGYRAYQPAQ